MGLKENGWLSVPVRHIAAIGDGPMNTTYYGKSGMAGQSKKRFPHRQQQRYDAYSLRRQRQ